MKLIDKLRHGSQEEIEEYCKDTIQHVIDVCDKVGVNATLNYEGAYLK